MQTPPIDYIIAEIRAVRDAHAARFGYDVQAIFNDIRASQKASGRTYVRHPPRRVAVDVEGESGPRERTRSTDDT